MGRHSLKAATIVILIGMALAACGDGSGTTPTLTAPTVVGALRIEMAAPDSIPPGESVQLTAIIFRPDGSTEDVTRQAQWSSSHTGVLRVAADGVATAVSHGEASISVRHQGRSAAKMVLAVPTGTFKLAGIVTEAGSPVAGGTDRRQPHGRACRRSTPEDLLWFRRTE
jgi:hypothetical protein